MGQRGGSDLVGWERYKEKAEGGVWFWMGWERDEEMGGGVYLGGKNPWHPWYSGLDFGSS